MFDNFGQQLYDNIIANDRWLMYLKGAGNTLAMTIGAAILGISNHCLTGEGGFLTDEWVTGMAEAALKAVTRAK